MPHPFPYARRLSPAVIAIVIFASAGLRAEEAVAPSAPAASYLADQAIDQKLGLVNRAWKINRVRVASRFDLPAQLAPGGPPPFDQQVEKTRSAGSPAGP